MDKLLPRNPTIIIIYLQVQWIEEQNQVLPLEVIQFDVLEVVVDNSCSAECRRRLLYLSNAKGSC